MTSEQTNVTSGSVLSELNNQREENDVDRRHRMKSVDELSGQIALVADIENTCRYPDVAGKWQTTRRELMSNPRIRVGAFCADNCMCWTRNACFYRASCLSRNKITAM